VSGWTELEPALRRRELGAILNAVEVFVRRFVVVDEAQATALTLWAAHTWAVEAAYATPYVFVTSAEPECGKTRLLEVLEQVVREPIFTMNISDAALFRTINRKRPTVFFDEVDSVFSRKAQERGHRDELRALLNAGYRRGQRVFRMGGGNNTTLEEFEVFGPKALAGLGSLPPTLSSRCIWIELKRRRLDDPSTTSTPTSSSSRPSCSVWSWRRGPRSRSSGYGRAGPSGSRGSATARPRSGVRCSQSPSSLARRGRPGPAVPRSRSPPAKTRTRRWAAAAHRLPDRLREAQGKADRHTRSDRRTRTSRGVALGRVVD
jgi:hypothetical protein